MRPLLGDHPVFVTSEVFSLGGDRVRPLRTEELIGRLQQPLAGCNSPGRIQKTKKETTKQTNKTATEETGRFEPASVQHETPSVGYRLRLCHAWTSRAHNPLYQPLLMVRGIDVFDRIVQKSQHVGPRYARGLATMPANMTANPKSVNFECR